MYQPISNPFEFTYIVWLPVNLDIDMHLLRHPINVSTHKTKPEAIRDRLAYVLGTITRTYEDQIEKGIISNRQEWIRICSKYLRYLVPDYNRYLDYSVKTGILEKGKNYRNSVSCTEYRFTPQYQSKSKKRYVILDGGFVNRIYSKRRTDDAINRYQHQFNFLQILTVDWTEANQILDKLYVADAHRRERQIQRLKAIEDPRKATFRIGATNRLYNTLCNIHENLRRCLRYRGQMLKGIDINNSIPFFSVSLFDKQIFNTQHIDILLRDINIHLVQADGTFAGWYILSDILNHTYNYPDISEYIKLVRNNELYDLLATKWNQTLGKSYNRKTAKKKLLKIFNSPATFESKEKDVLKNLFPNLMHAIDQTNTGYFKTKGGKGKSKWHPGDQECPFSHVTQILEARVVLDYVCKAIELHDPDIPIFTLHDCIFTVPEHVDTVKAITKHEIQKVMGFPPKVSIKD